VLVVPAPAPTTDEVIAQIAARSHGVVTRRELLDAGISRAEIEHRLRKGSLLREHLGVFRVGHRAPSIEARYLAAVRACGEVAALSGRAAAHLYGLVAEPPPLPEVTCRGRRRVKGVRTRRTSVIDGTTYRGIPIATVARTLVDLAAVLGPEALGRACHEAGVKYGTTPRQIREILDRRPNSRGAGKLHRIISGEDPITLSKLERSFRDLLCGAGLPLPVTNKPAGGHRVDCRWPDAQLTVELDGYRYHSSRHAWERDRRREREARARGDEFRRYTWGDVDEEPAETVAELRRLLSR
jgi:very-short-patch-repair endonuclease